MANDILIPGEKQFDGGREITVVYFKDRWIAVDFIRKGLINSTHPEEHHVQLRDIDTNEIISTGMYGLIAHHAFVWKDWLYIFATDHSNIWMSRVKYFDAWSRPKIVLDSDNMNGLWINNNTVVYNGECFIMAMDLVGGPYTNTICFARSYDLNNWHFVPGAVYRPHLYTAAPIMKYDNGWYYLFHCRGIEKWFFETYVARSRDLLYWEDSPHNPVLSPDPNEILPPLREGDTTIYHSCNYSDLEVYERDGKTIGYFTVATQTADVQAYVQRADYDGPIREFFEKLFDKI